MLIGVWVKVTPVMIVLLHSFLAGYSPKTPGSDPYQPPDPYATTPAAIPDGYEMTTSIFPLDSCYFNPWEFFVSKNSIQFLGTGSCKWKFLTTWLFAEKVYYIPFVRCCNKELEALMEQAYDDKAKSRDGKWPTCNIHQVAVDVQKAAQEKFGVDFETISSAGKIWIAGFSFLCF